MTGVVTVKVAQPPATSPSHATAVLRTGDGRTVLLPWERWFGAARPEEERVLDMVRGPALDIGCGPGRLAAALIRRGVAVLGVDTAPAAASIAGRRGVQVIVRSVFDRIPGAGDWRTVLLIDGNLGIGGDPQALLARVRGLLRSPGRVLVEVEPPGVVTRRLDVRLEVDGVPGEAWFPWAQVGADALSDLAVRSGFEIEEMWTQEDRWFARLGL